MNPTNPTATQHSKHPNTAPAWTPGPDDGKDLIWIAQRFLGIRKAQESRAWTKTEVDRSLRDLEAKARAILARIQGH